MSLETKIFRKRKEKYKYKIVGCLHNFFKTKFEFGNISRVHGIFCLKQTKNVLCISIFWKGLEILSNPKTSEWPWHLDNISHWKKSRFLEKIANSRSWARNEWEASNILSFWKARRLSKTTEVMLKGLKSQLKEVSTGYRLDNLSINNSNNNCKWTKTHHGCLHPWVYNDT